MKYPILETTASMTGRSMKISAPAVPISMNRTIEELDTALSSPGAFVIDMSEQTFWDLRNFWQDLDSQLKLFLPFSHEETYIENSKVLVFLKKSP